MHMYLHDAVWSPGLGLCLGDFSLAAISRFLKLLACWDFSFSETSRFLRLLAFFLVISAYPNQFGMLLKYVWEIDSV